MSQARDAAIPMGTTPVSTDGAMPFPIFTLDIETWPSLLALSAELHVTSLSLLGAAFATLLHRYTMQDIITMGITADDQSASDENISRLWAIIQLDFASDPTYQASVQQVHSQAQAYQQVHRADLPTPQATLHILKDVHGWQGYIEYSSELFASLPMARLSQLFIRLLHLLLAAPDVAISRAALLNSTSPDPSERAEWQRVVVDWNKTASDYPREATLAAVFTSRAQSNPDTIAVVSDGEQITYGALLARASQLAHHLHALGVGPDIPVGLCLERSADLIPTLLGIVLAGGAYVPFDPTYPAARLQQMSTDAGAALVLTQSHLHASLLDVGVPLLDIETLWSQVANLPITPPMVQGSAQQLAYICYTSGSTGVPKGVAIPHRAVLRLILGTNYASFGPDETFLQFAPLAFDAATLEIWGPLLTGGRLVVADPGLVPLDVLGETLIKEGITTLWLTAGLFHLMVEEQLTSLRGVRHLLAGGDVLRPAIVKRVLEAYPDHVLTNGYGPTETTTFATTYAMNGTTSIGQSVPIGKPIANSTAYVLDAWLQPVPIGMPGELYLGGDGLARGYWHRPDLTEERFIPHPFLPSERLYKTGDLVRWCEDGNLEFLGRHDGQVKIRGYRIELGEIERVLEQLEGVQASVVIVNEAYDDKRLIGYVVGKEIDGARLHEHLQRLLPPYLVPSSIMVLDALPLTPNGKVDRRALPQPKLNEGSDYLHGKSDPPQGQEETAIATIWAGVLHRDDIGRHDDFFALGGHSLLATQLVARLRAAFQVNLSLDALFEAPTIAQLAERIALAKVTPHPVDNIPALISQTHDTPQQLSYAQERMWFLDQLQPDSALYVVALAVSLNRAMDVSTLKQALAVVVAHHESLRTTFMSTPDGPLQIIAPTAQIPLRVVDLRELPPHEREEVIHRETTQEAQTPFQLEGGSLARMVAIQVNADETMLLMSLHHIISDGWSMAVFIQDLLTSYDALMANQSPTLPQLTVHYADYAVWQRQWLSAGEIDSQLAYWRQRLNDAPTLLDMPTDQPRPSLPSYQGMRQGFDISADLTQRLREISHHEGVTLYMTLLTAFEELLHRYTRQEDFLVGTVVAGRQRPEFDHLIGFFVNTLPLRVNLMGDPTFHEALTRTRQMTLDAFRHQDVPFERIVEAVHPTRDLSYHPLIQVMFILQNTALGTLDAADGSLRVVESETGTSQFDLMLEVTETGEGLHGVFQYATDLFDATTITRMSEQLVRLIEAMVDAPDQPISSHALLSAAETQRLLVDWNDNVVPIPMATLPMLVEQQAMRTSTDIALVASDATLTYAELNTYSNQLAHALHTRGIKTGQIVGVCLNRTTNLIVTILGILKTGAAYLPLDPTYPLERLTYSLADAQAALLVTSSDLGDIFQGETTPMIMIDQMRDELAHSPTGNLDQSTDPAALAYLIYTSGSTGRPKGVAIAHQSAVAMIAWAQTVYMPEDLRGVLAATSVCFDLSIFEIFVPLSNGGAIILAENALELLTLHAREQVTLVNTVPSALNELSQMGGIPSSVRILNIAGEPLAKSLVERLYEISSVRQIYNLYGPTEDTTYSTWAAIPRDSRSAPSIGRPIANSQLYILDDHLHPTPIGIPGEIYLAGAGLAKGYLGRPDLTAERFIQNPFAGSAGARMYRTGDLGRYRPDAEVEYLGRIDQQVKVRGFRIELGEIESVLDRGAGVHENVVVVRDDASGNNQIVAYIVADDATTNETLHDTLRAYLPSYMIPAAFVRLDALPLTPNGKVNRRALPDPIWHDEESYVAPRNEREIQLAAIWAEVLHLDRVGVMENFFALGGHSLLATRLIARIRAKMAPDLPLRVLFSSPTIAQMATAMDDLLPSSSNTQEITHVSRDVPLLLSSGQERVWFFDQLTPGTVLYNVPFALRLGFTVDEMVLAETLHSLMLRHESWRTTFQATEAGPRQHIAREISVPLRVVDLQSLPEAERDRATQVEVEQEANTSFDLANGPLVRVAILRLQANKTILIITQHHIITDGASLDLLLDELLTTYQTLRDGQAPTLPTATFDYADYAMWQRTWLNSTESQRQLAEWRAKIANYPDILDLPTDYARPVLQTYRGATHTFAFDADLVTNIRDLSRANGVTPYTILLATFEILLRRYTQQESFLVATALAGRNQATLERVWGFFVNTLPLPVDLEDDPSFVVLLQRTLQTVLWAQDYNEIPLDLIIEAVQPTRDASHTPLVQVFFTATEPSEQIQHFSDAAIAPLDWNLPIAKFDLSLDVTMGHGGWQGHLEYNTDLFASATIDRLSQHFTRLLRALLAEPDRAISRSALLDSTSPDPDERVEWQHVVFDWNETTSPYPRDATLGSIFTTQAQATPDAIAVISDGEQLTYGALLARASQLAHHLRSLGVGPDVPVGLCVERSPHLIPSIMGIILAGGAYVTLDPSYPPARLTQLLGDSGATLVLTQSHLHGPLTGVGTHLFDIETLWSQVADLPTTPPVVNGSAQQLAYVCYTSGSTGMPKGVAIPHRGVLRLVLGTNYATFGPGETYFQFSALAFDVATMEIWGALLTGGRLVVPPAGLVPLDVIGNEILREGVTTLWLTAGLFHLMVEEQLSSLRCVRHLIAGGDILRPAAVQKVIETYPDHLMTNGYGPTENTTFATSYSLRESTHIGRSVPIGTPIANSTAYVLDTYHRPQPIGVPGDLYLGGDGLARGYWQRPDLTAERFIPHPFVEGERLYWSGDLARWLADGTIEFLGRRDGQVKLRGFRIEVGEIERVLEQQPQVQTSVVVVRTGTDGEKRLVGYVVGPGLEAQSVRKSLEGLLPAYMVPSAIIVLDALPLSPSGKVDRRSLPEPEQWSQNNDHALTSDPPQTEQEARIAVIWSGVLHREKIGRNDDFFAIGGHSLLATQLVARLRIAFNVDMPLLAIFEYSSIAALALYLETLQGTQLNPVSTEQIQRVARGDKDLAQLVEMIEQLSEEDIKTLLAEDVAEE